MDVTESAVAEILKLTRDRAKAPNHAMSLVPGGVAVPFFYCRNSGAGLVYFTSALSLYSLGT
ncbi:hypothetical protein AXX17_AT1G00500 [Arabidopsis thaliana]|uniref:Uncharacterized protein n=1 Tax=Arabidopsis thaliana TaxID=3702 RepID=A0A178W1J4_ARATH|nr:hypothetical protein AXX17_AT1G00500 [Arabidopsis thaliana]